MILKPVKIVVVYLSRLPALGFCSPSSMSLAFSKIAVFMLAFQIPLYRQPGGRCHDYVQPDQLSF